MRWIREGIDRWFIYRMEKWYGGNLKREYVLEQILNVINCGYNPLLMIGTSEPMWEEDFEEVITLIKKEMKLFKEKGGEPIKIRVRYWGII